MENKVHGNILNIKSSEDRKKTLVLFDAGAVLVKMDFNKFYLRGSKLSGNLSHLQFKERYLESGLEKDFLLGRISTSDYLSTLENLLLPNRRIYHDELEKLSLSFLDGIVQPVIHLKKRIHELGYRIGIFSNSNEFVHRILTKTNPEVFDVYDSKNPCVLSFKVKSIKPENGMYNEIKGFDKVIFIDDKELYLRKGIEDFSWMGIHYKEYIDLNEPIRTIHNDNTIPAKSFYSAEKFDDLILGLKYFGINLN